MFSSEILSVGILNVIAHVHTCPVVRKWQLTYGKLPNETFTICHSNELFNS